MKFKNDSQRKAVMSKLHGSGQNTGGGLSQVRARQDKKYIGYNGRLIKPNERTKKEIIDYIRGGVFERNTNFYVGNIDLGSQGIMVNVPVKTKIEVDTVRSNDIVFRWKEIKPSQDLGYLYDQEVKSLINNNKMYEKEIREKTDKQRTAFIVGAEERIKKSQNEKFYFDVPNKQKIVNFVNESKKLN